MPRYLAIERAMCIRDFTPGSMPFTESVRVRLADAEQPMSVVNPQIRFVYEDYKSLPESMAKRYELLDGEILMLPAPTRARSPKTELF